MESAATPPSRPSDLARTFWLAGVAGNGAFLAIDALAHGIDESQSFGPIVFLAAIAYFVMSFRLVWKCARAYGGPAVWAWLARTVMVVWALFHAVLLVLYPYLIN